MSSEESTYSVYGDNSTSPLTGTNQPVIRSVNNTYTNRNPKQNQFLYHLGGGGSSGTISAMSNASSSSCSSSSSSSSSSPYSSYLMNPKQLTQSSHDDTSEISTLISQDDITYNMNQINQISFDDYNNKPNINQHTRYFNKYNDRYRFNKHNQSTLNEEKEDSDDQKYSDTDDKSDDEEQSDPDIDRHIQSVLSLGPNTIHTRRISHQKHIQTKPKRRFVYGQTIINSVNTQNHQSETDFSLLSTPSDSTSDITTIPGISTDTIFTNVNEDILTSELAALKKQFNKIKKRKYQRKIKTNNNQNNNDLNTKHSESSVYYDEYQTDSVYILPYPKYQRKSALVGGCCGRLIDLSTEYCIVIVSFSVLFFICVGLMAAAIAVTFEGYKIDLYSDSFTISGLCKTLSAVRNDNYSDYVFTPYCLPECDGIKVSGSYTFQKKDSTRKLIAGQIINCYTNKGCDKILLSNGYNKWDTEAGGTYFGAAILYVLSFVWLYYVGQKWYYNVWRFFLAQRKIIKVGCDNWCKYYTGKDKRNHYTNCWDQLPIKNKLDYFMSFYGRKYKLNFSDRIWKTLGTFVVDVNNDNNVSKRRLQVSINDDTQSSHGDYSFLYGTQKKTKMSSLYQISTSSLIEHGQFGIETEDINELKKGSLTLPRAKVSISRRSNQNDRVNYYKRTNRKKNSQIQSNPQSLTINRYRNDKSYMNDKKVLSQNNPWAQFAICNQEHMDV